MPPDETSPDISTNSSPAWLKLTYNAVYGSKIGAVACEIMREPETPCHGNTPKGLFACFVMPRMKYTENVY